MAANLSKVLFAALKDKKSCHDDNERKSAFQTTAIELYKQAKKEHLRLIVKCIRTGLAAKADDEVYVLKEHSQV